MTTLVEFMNKLEKDHGLKAQTVTTFHKLRVAVNLINSYLKFDEGRAIIHELSAGTGVNAIVGLLKKDRGTTNTDDGYLVERNCASIRHMTGLLALAGEQKRSPEQILRISYYPRYLAPYIVHISPSGEITLKLFSRLIWHECESVDVIESFDTSDLDVIPEHYYDRDSVSFNKEFQVIKTSLIPKGFDLLMEKLDNLETKFQEPETKTLPNTLGWPNVYFVEMNRIGKYVLLSSFSSNKEPFFTSTHKFLNELIESNFPDLPGRMRVNSSIISKINSNLMSDLIGGELPSTIACLYKFLPAENIWEVIQGMPKDMQQKISRIAEGIDENDGQMQSIYREVERILERKISKSLSNEEIDLLRD